jgi:hypothetical protein
VGEFMENKTDKSLKNKKESIWRDRNSQHPEWKCSSGMVFKTKKVKSG